MATFDEYGTCCVCESEMETCGIIQLDYKVESEVDGDVLSAIYRCKARWRLFAVAVLTNMVRTWKIR